MKYVAINCDIFRVINSLHCIVTLKPVFNNALNWVIRAIFVHRIAMPVPCPVNERTYHENRHSWVNGTGQATHAEQIGGGGHYYYYYYYYYWYKWNER